jgi:hypothetical protein
LGGGMKSILQRAEGKSMVSVQAILSKIAGRWPAFVLGLGFAISVVWLAVLIGLMVHLFHVV